jgi:hypothetical protein
MKKLMLPQRDPSSNKITPIYRILLAVVAGGLICVGGEFMSYRELYRLPGFRLAMSTSILIALIAVEQVSYNVLRLRKRFPDEIFGSSRIFRQIVTCLLLPFILIFCLASSYYAFHDIFILDTMWISDHAAHIIIMLTALNMVFIIAELSAKYQVGEKDLPQAEINPNLKTDTIVDVIAFVKHENGCNWVTHINGEIIYDFRTLKEIYRSFDRNLYTLNGKQSIVRRDNILKASKVNGSGCNLEFVYPAGAVLYVSGRQSLHYRAYY